MTPENWRVLPLECMDSRDALEVLFWASILELANALEVFEESTGRDANMMEEFAGAHTMLRVYILWRGQQARVIELLPGLVERERPLRRYVSRMCGECDHLVTYSETEMNWLSS